MKKTKKNVIKIGDDVKIVNPLVVTRVGYPLSWYNVLLELDTPENRQRIIDMLNDFDVGTRNNKLDVFNGSICESQVREILQKVAYYTLQSRKFGGPERTLHTTNAPHLKDVVSRVTDKKVVKTGTRISGSGSCFNEDYEPPFLSNVKSHTLLGFYFNGNTIGINNPYWIEDINVSRGTETDDDFISE